MTKKVNVNERLSKLEEELDHLITLQEKIKTSKGSVEYGVVLQRPENRRQRCPCVNSTSCIRTLSNDHQVLSQCKGGDSAPLADITKFLQHINLNLFKGTQAITKIAKSASQTRSEGGHNTITYHENCFKKTESSQDTQIPNSLGKKIDEDALYKELREEKDKRQRAENQIKQIKDELKTTKNEQQHSFDTRVLRLQEELRETLDRLSTVKQELEKRTQECQHAEHVWPYKYEAVCKELQEERAKRSEVERNVKQLQEMLQKVYVQSEELFTLRKTSSWLKDQNESLICLSKKLKSEVEDKIADVSRKNQTIEENLRRIKQLTCLCEKLRDFLIVVRRRATDNEDRLKESEARSQKLTDKLLEEQTTRGKTDAALERDRCEHNRLKQLTSTLTAANRALQNRVEEMSEIMKEQNRLIARQSETIYVKDDQLRLASEHKKLQSQKIVDLEKKNIPSALSLSLESQVDRIKLDLENKTEMLLIKEKIIESHLQSISQLKNTLDRKEEEINRKRREITEIERKLEIEKTNNEQLESKVKYLLNQKEELKKTIKELEEELENQVSSEESCRLEQIEKQVRQKQKEWEEGKAILIREKESALEAKRCSSQMLLEKTAECDAKTTALKFQVDKLTEELNEKDEQLSQATEKISKLTSELKGADELAEITRKSFQEKLQSACEAWKKTMALLQIDN